MVLLCFPFAVDQRTSSGCSCRTRSALSGLSAPAPHTLITTIVLHVIQRTHKSSQSLKLGQIFDFLKLLAFCRPGT